jgi:precorrin-6B C5,15-methyltransferase / cobalt-precorrin-6B C5,C15-methyltransferase
MDALSTGAELLSREAPRRPWLAIIGLGEDGRDGLTRAAAEALDGARFVVGGARHLALVQPLQAETLAWPSPLSAAYPSILARRGEPVAVLASGDPFHYGVGAELARLVAPDEFVSFPQPSSFSLAAARLGWPLAECSLVSLHGRRLERVIPLLQPRARLLALAWDGTTPERLAALLKSRGFGTSRITVLEAMGGPRERVRHDTAERFALQDIDPLNLVAVEVVGGSAAQVITLAPGRDDELFEHDGQITKAEVRAMTLAALRPRAGERLWDIGAGSGSVSIEWCLAHPANRAVAIEARPERADRIRRNALSFGATEIEVVEGRAPVALAVLDPPDAVFVGGGASAPGLLDSLAERLPTGGRLVVNAVTLETEAVLAEAYRRHGGALTRIALSRLEPVGRLHGWRAAMPVTQWAWVKP